MLKYPAELPGKWVKRLLELSDLSVFDFVIGNKDRFHMYILHVAASTAPVAFQIYEFTMSRVDDNGKDITKYPPGRRAKGFDTGAEEQSGPKKQAQSTCASKESLADAKQPKKLQKKKSPMLAANKASSVKLHSVASLQSQSRTGAASPCSTSSEELHSHSNACSSSQSGCIPKSTALRTPLNESHVMSRQSTVDPHRSSKTRFERHKIHQNGLDRLLAMYNVFTLFPGGPIQAVDQSDSFLQIINAGPCT